MTRANELDPTESVLNFYATDLRRKREASGINQRTFAKMALIAPSLLNKIESATRLPTKELSVLADVTFGTGEHFQNLWKLVIRYAYPAWFRPWVELEEEAAAIRNFELQLVPGLLQTEAYARAVFASARPGADVLEEKVAARMERQRILEREQPPELWVVLDEYVLRRPVGNAGIMRAQFARLIEAASVPSTVFQILPLSAGPAGSEGPFSVLTLDEGPGVVYADGFRQGQILTDPQDVKAAHRVYDLLMGLALSPAASIDLIADAMRDLR
jgi:transcriptional regulator with XRE-family HTH domain